MSEIKKYRNELPRFYAQSVADKLNCKPTKVYKVAAGEIVDEQIELELFTLIQTRRDYRKKISEIQKGL